MFVNRYFSLFANRCRARVNVATNDMDGSWKSTSRMERKLCINWYNRRANMKLKWVMCAKLPGKSVAASFALDCSEIELFTVINSLYWSMSNAGEQSLWFCEPDASNHHAHIRTPTPTVVATNMVETVCGKTPHQKHAVHRIVLGCMYRIVPSVR